LHKEWQFVLTKTYNDSDTVEWKVPKTVRITNPHGIGEGGAGFVPTNDTVQLIESLKKEHNFNLLASEMISLHRSLPDIRYDECKALTYPEKLPTTSVIIIFHNEAWTTLLRTVWSVIDRSPVELIKEITLVDDKSTWDFLKRPLADYIDTLPVPVKLIRNANREGLIRSRLIGAQHATGQVLIFLDAHIECCEGWLQPLLARIATDRSVVAVPLIDVISSDDMQYKYNKKTIKSASNRTCLDIFTGGAGHKVKVLNCHHQGGNQLFGYTKNNKIVTSQEHCIGVGNTSIISVDCMDGEPQLQWKYNYETHWLVHVGSGLCMKTFRKKAQLGECDRNDD
ncbi:Polypeptide N-acetylgalactosaminyltransferase 1, partial [Pseudolycoriella hygida]